LDSQGRERPQQEPGLFGGPPTSVARTFAIAEPRPVEGDDAMARGDALGDAAGKEVADHAAVAVQEDDGSSATAREIVKTHSIDADEIINRRVIGLRRRNAHEAIPRPSAVQRPTHAAYTLCKGRTFSVD